MRRPIFTALVLSSLGCGTTVQDLGGGAGGQPTVSTSPPGTGGARPVPSGPASSSHPSTTLVSTTLASTTSAPPAVCTYSLPSSDAGAACHGGPACTTPFAFGAAPVGYWRFSDCSGKNATLADSSGHGFGAQKQAGVACVAGVSGQASDLAVAFDGDAGALTVPDEPAFHLTTAATVAAWVKPLSLTTHQTILNKWYGPDSYMLYMEAGQFLFSVALEGDASVLGFQAAAPGSPDVWTHVAGVYDGKTVSIYLNGALANQTPAAGGTLQPSGIDLGIGNWPSWNAFTGSLDEVWLGASALSGDQIVQLMGRCGLCGNTSCQ